MVAVCPGHAATPAIRQPVSMCTKKLVGEAELVFVRGQNSLSLSLSFTLSLFLSARKDFRKRERERERERTSVATLAKSNRVREVHVPGISNLRVYPRS